MNKNDNYTLWIISVVFLAIFLANATAKLGARSSLPETDNSTVNAALR